MQVIKTPIKDLVIIEPKVIKDSRGYFFEAYQKEKYSANGITANFLQDNQAFSTYGVIRGLHYQKGEFSQAKLVSVVQGKVFDVAVDLRKNSETFGQWYGVELTEENKRQFFIPKGFAHGYSVLSETALFTYKCDEVYAPHSEGGVNLHDEALNIDWQIPRDKQIISDKDKNWANLENADF